MEELLPFFDVSGPHGEHFRVALNKDRITIGRFELFNDVALEPDPQHLITRKAHCIIEQGESGWWVIDNGSVNRTLIRRESKIEIVQGREHLEDGDAVLILGELAESGKPSYWELIFCDPMGTRASSAHLSVVTYLEYDQIQAKLFRVTGSKRQEIQDLRLQEHKLLRYMDQRNRDNNNVPVMCKNEELLKAVWGEDAAYHTKEELAHLIYELRQKLEPDPNGPHFLENVRRMGYRLISGS